ncbi:MAG: hypothetical protein U0271_35225 [Polyangiaceae bacterium]
METQATVVIPAASLNGISASHPPEVRRELERLFDLATHEDTQENLVELCKLLLSVNERSKSHDLLRANARPGRPSEAFYARTFPDGVASFQLARLRLADVLDVAIRDEVPDAFRILDADYECVLCNRFRQHEWVKPLIRRGKCRVRLSYEQNGCTEGDIYDPIAARGKLIIFDGSTWTGLRGAPGGY